MNDKKQWHKIALAWAGVFAFRLILLPVRAPNVEPLMATLMPTSARLSLLQSFAFGALSIVIYDAFTSGWGMWTAVTALAYGAVAIASHLIFSRTAGTRMRFVAFSVVATILYDAVTGLTVGPLFFHQTLAAAFIGQIPFTMMHLTANVAFAATLSPVLSRWFAAAPAAVTVAEKQIA
jgi:hypothetical protein